MVETFYFNTNYYSTVPNTWAAGSMELGRGPYKFNIISPLLTYIYLK